MSMNFSEFKRRLGAEPRSEDAEMLAARDASSEHRAAVAEAEQFEHRLERALNTPVPADLIDTLRTIPAGKNHGRRWWPVALAAGLLVAVGAAGLSWRAAPDWPSVEAYVMDHYRHDGGRLVAESFEAGYGNVHEVLAEFGLDAEPALANIVGLVKFCPTPDGKGVHMVLHTHDGPLTVIFMPETDVEDGERWAFDEMDVLLVDLERGSAAVIGSNRDQLSEYYAVLQDSLVVQSDRS
ncbi:MAG: DUF3379 domain-containing protein [Gammaproteobacteria bacterium]|nr:DUF3379 domain-containing protein [Gammaproteobacteria bacterium]